MAKEQALPVEDEPIEEPIPEQEAAPTQAEAMTEDQLQAAIKEASIANDWPKVKKLAGELDKLAKAAEKAAKDALQAKLAEVTAEVRKVIDKAVAPLIDSGQLDGADGIWYVRDFGEAESACRIQKSAKRATGEGGGKSSYVADPRKSADMLAAVGDEVMFAEETTVTIDKAEHQMPAGTTLKQAYDYSTNGGWRNRVRMAIIKAMDKA